MGFLQGTFSTPENKSKFLPCDVGIPGPNFFVPKSQQKNGGKKNVAKDGPLASIRDPSTHPCHWNPPIFFKTLREPVDWISFNIQQLQHLRPPGEIEIAFRWVKLLWLSHWMFPEGLGLPSPMMAHDETMRLFRHGKKLGIFCFPSKTVGSIRMLPRHHETWHFYLKTFTYSRAMVWFRRSKAYHIQGWWNLKEDIWYHENLRLPPTNATPASPRNKALLPTTIP